MPDEMHEDEPMYVISVAARLVNMHPQTLRYYERAGLVKPTRSRGHIRLYSQRDIERLRKIARLTESLGVNLAGVEVILRLTETLAQVQGELEKHKIRLASDYTIPNEFVVEDSELPVTPDPAGRRTAKTHEVKNTSKGRRAR
jgi:MerR family transcriptional regulator, heat shock protein HspR